MYMNYENSLLVCLFGWMYWFGMVIFFVGLGILVNIDLLFVE